MTHQQKEFIDPTEAALYLGLSPGTLARWRSEKSNLPYTKIGGAVRYKKSDLDAYANSRRIAIGAT